MSDDDSMILKLSKLDIGVHEVEKHPAVDHETSWLKLHFKGSDINNKMINAFRRVSMDNLPTYAFPKDQIKIEFNTAVAFNNDEIKLRFGSFPVMGIDPGLSFLSEKYWYNVNFGDPKREKHPSEKDVDIYINSNNNSANITCVTTNDIEVYIDNNHVKPYNEKVPIALIKLRPNDTFKCHMKAVLGVGELDARWRMSNNSYFKEIINGDKKEYELSVEGNGQTDEYNIVIRSCKFLMKKLIDVKQEIQMRINSKEIPHKKSLKVKLDGEDHTIGEIINYELQGHNDIFFAGVAKTDHLIKSITFTMICNPDVDTPINAMLDCIDKLCKKFSHVGKLLIELKDSNKPSKK